MRNNAARFCCGQRVSAAVDIDNVATGSTTSPGSRPITRGTLGSVVGVGRHATGAAPVYLVVFAGAVVVGCREGELDAVTAVSSRRRD
jgi:hypothetical protein